MQRALWSCFPFRMWAGIWVCWGKRRPPWFVASTFPPLQEFIVGEVRITFGLRSAWRAGHSCASLNGSGSGERTPLLWPLLTPCGFVSFTVSLVILVMHTIDSSAKL